MRIFNECLATSSVGALYKKNFRYFLMEKLGLHGYKDVENFRNADVK